ncbi:MAG TPA: hypothetical protein VGF76_11390 [Polyangiaceae bacterium]
MLDMAALRGVGEGLELLLEEGVPGFGRADDSGAPEWGPGSGLVRVTEELFSKLRAGVLTIALAASLLRCAGALSFFAPDGGAGVLVWGAREVMGTPESKKLFNLQYVQLAETDSSNSLAQWPIFTNRQKPP